MDHEMYKIIISACFIAFSPLINAAERISIDYGAPNHADYQLHQDDHARYLYYVCSRVVHPRPGQSCRHCSAVRAYNVNAKHVLGRKNWRKHTFRFHPETICQRLRFAPNQYRVFNSAVAAKQWQSRYCNCQARYF